MMTATISARDIVNGLIEICRDGEHGFESASKEIDDLRLKTELLQYSRQRQEFANELHTALDQFGANVDDHGSVSAALHRGWMALKQAVASNNRHAILAECERGEDSAVEAYRDAVNYHLPEPLADLVESQYEAVQRVHDRIKGLRDERSN